MNNKQKLERANLALSILNQDKPHKAEFSVLRSIVEPLVKVHIKSIEKAIDIDIKCGRSVGVNEFTNIQRRAIINMSQTDGCKYTLDNCIFMRQLENGGYVTIENGKARLTKKGKSTAFSLEKKRGRNG